MKRLARLLDCDHLMAVGIMESLWHWTAKYAPAGDIGKHSDEDIADGIGYRGDKSRLVATLADCGWLDRCERHRLIVHDWHQHADDAVKKSAERNRVCLISQAIRSVGTSPDSVATSPDKNRLPEPEPEPMPEPEPEPERARAAPTSCKRTFKPPALQQIIDYCREAEIQIDPERFLDHYTANGWRVGKAGMKDWKAAVRNWAKNDFNNGNGKTNGKTKSAESAYQELTPIR
jgi:hypothetical protein